MVSEFSDGEWSPSAHLGDKVENRLVDFFEPVGHVRGHEQDVAIGDSAIYAAAQRWCSDFVGFGFLAADRSAAGGKGSGAADDIDEVCVFGMDFDLAWFIAPENVDAVIALGIAAVEQAAVRGSLRDESLGEEDYAGGIQRGFGCRSYSSGFCLWGEGPILGPRIGGGLRRAECERNRNEQNEIEEMFRLVFHDFVSPSFSGVVDAGLESDSIVRLNTEGELAEHCAQIGAERSEWRAVKRFPGTGEGRIIQVMKRDFLPESCCPAKKSANFCR